MKKLILSASVALAVMFGASSCSNTSEPVSKGKGNVTVEFAFDQTTKAPTSTAKPTTSWDGNIKNMMILFVEGTTVKDARAITVPTGADIAAKPVAFTGIVAGNYTAYVIANYTDARDTYRINPIVSGGGAWGASSVVGKNISSLLMELVAYPTLTVSDQPAEIFLASQPVNVVADANTSVPSPFSLKRAISLFRVLVDPTTTNTGKVAFNEDGANVQVRRVATSINPLKTVAYAATRNAGVVYAKKFETANPATGYTAGTILGNGSTATAWKDVRIFPGGSTTVNSEKFNVLITGIVKVANYPTANGVAAGIGDPVWWQGEVTAVVAENNILEVTIPLNSYGNGGGNTDPISTGNLEITVSLEEWGNISGVVLPM